MKKYIILVFATFTFSNLYCQCSEWQKIIESKQYQIWSGKQSVVIGNNGNIYKVFKFFDTINIDGFSLYGDSGGFLNWNNMGILGINSITKKVFFVNYTKSKSRYNEYPRIAYNDYSKEIVVCGYTNDSALQFDNKQVTKNELFYVYLSKFDTLGKCNFIIKPITVNDSNSYIGYATNTVCDKMGNIYISGFYTGVINISGKAYSTVPGFSKYFLAKFDNNGNNIWVNDTINSDFIQNKDITIDDNGNIYSAIDFGDKLKYNSDSIKNKSPFGGTDVAIIKFDSTGKIIWVTAGGDIGSDYVYGCTVDKNFNVYACGNFAGSFKIQGKQIYGGSSSAYVFSLDSKGKLRWIKPLVDSVDATSFSIQVLDNNKIICTTNFSSQLQIDNVILNSKVVDNSGYPNTAYFIMDDLGNIFKYSQMGSKVGSGSNVYVSNKDIYIEGGFISDINLDTTKYIFTDTIPKSFLWKLCEDKLLGVDKYEINLRKSFLIYPNPASSAFTIEHATQQKEDLTIYNTLGELVYKDTWPRGQTLRNIDMSALPKGIYIIRIGDAVQKVVRE